MRTLVGLARLHRIKRIREARDNYVRKACLKHLTATEKSMIEALFGNI
jgi:hypothetical protein